MSQQLHRGLGKLEGMLSEVLRNQQEFKLTFEKHDTRLRVIEGNYMKGLGIVTAITFAFTTLWETIKSKLLHF
jgi:hypothetical protein